MASNNHAPARKSGRKAASSHGAFKHRTEPASMKTVLAAYGLKPSDYARMKDLVSKKLGKTVAHGR
jgi:hypothetical protein